MTKVGSDMGQGKTLARSWIMQEVEASLRRLRTDVIDLYQSHWPDDATPHEETLSAYDELIKAGKVRKIGASNFSRRANCVRPSIPPTRTACRATTPCSRSTISTTAPASTARCGSWRSTRSIGVITYFSLAAGFLSGKYRSKADLSKSRRGSRVEKYLDDRGMKILAALDAVASEHDAKAGGSGARLGDRQQGRDSADRQRHEPPPARELRQGRQA